MSTKNKKKPQQAGKKVTVDKSGEEFPEVEKSNPLGISMDAIYTLMSDFWSGYTSKTTKRIKMLDCFNLLCFIIGVIQLAYCFLVGTFPKNSFLSGIFASWGALILTGLI